MIIRFKKQFLQRDEQYRKKYHSSESRWPSPLRGATSEDIKRVMVSQNVSYLPPIYEEFLSIAGYGDIPWFVGSDIRVDHLYDIKEALFEDLVFNGLWESKYKDIFVFMSHQGYIYSFFFTIPNNPNPPVYEFYSKEFHKCNTSLYNFLLIGRCD